MPLRLAVTDLAYSPNPRDGQALRRVGRVAEALALGLSRHALRLHLDRLLHQSRLRFLRPSHGCSRQEGSFGLSHWDQS